MRFRAGGGDAAEAASSGWPGVLPGEYADSSSLSSRDSALISAALYETPVSGDRTGGAPSAGASPCDESSASILARMDSALWSRPTASPAAL